MGTVSRSQPPESDSQLPITNYPITMQLSAVITFSMVLFSFVSLTEAGINQYGACYCKARACTEVTSMTKCDPGYTCFCNYNENLDRCYGECTLDNNLRYTLPKRPAPYVVCNCGTTGIFEPEGPNCPDQCEKTTGFKCLVF